MESNLYRQLLSLLPEAPLLSGEVTVQHADGTVTVELPGGGTVRARGVYTAGDTVFVRGDLVEGPAPDLPFAEIEI
jgi:hypothetical protein